MRKIIVVALITAFISCKNNSDKTAEFEKRDSIVAPVEAEKLETKAVPTDCPSGETLIFEDDKIKSSTEDAVRGQGIVTFDLQPGNKLALLNDDGSVFGEITSKEDLTFESTLPKQVTARKLILNSDFSAFEFDAEPVATDKDFVFVYLNKLKKKVKKSQVKFSFTSWDAYMKAQTLHLKDCNLLKDAQNVTLPKSKGLSFDVVEVKGDSLKIKSTKECLEDGAAYQNLEGWIVWKSGNKLQVNFAICN